MFRLIYLTFYGKERMSEETRSHIHESPKSMTVPLMVLGVLSVIGGFVGMPHIFGVVNVFERWLEPVMKAGSLGQAEHVLASGGGDTGMEWTLMFCSVMLVAVAIYLAYYFYNKHTEAATSMKKRFSGVHRLLLNKYYIDEVYGAAIVRPLVYFSLFLWKFIDVVLIDGLLDGLAKLCRDASDLLRYSQSGQLRTYATIFVVGVLIILAYFVLG